MRIKSAIGYLNLRHKLAYYIKKRFKSSFYKTKIKNVRIPASIKFTKLRSKVEQKKHK